MIEPTDAPESTPDDSDALAGPPRWVKVVAIVAAALLVLFLVLQLTGQAAQHGPGRHGHPSLGGAHLALGEAGDVW